MQQLWERIRDNIVLVATGMAVLLLGFGLITKPAAADGLPSKSGALVPIGEVAAAASNWTGLYIGVHGGYGVAVGELTTPDGDSLIRGLSADGFIGGVHGGADYQFSGTPWVVGVRGAYTWSNMEFSADGGDLTVGIGNGWSADGRIGYAMGNALPYVFGGYTEVATSNNAGASSPTLKGWRGGTGVEFRIPGAQFVTLGLDYTYTRYESVDIDECLTVDPEDHRVLARLNFRLSGR
jgi:outer membrane immunogenic protein